MQLKPKIWIIIFYIAILFSVNVKASEANEYTAEFKNAEFQSCDETFHKLENMKDACTHMGCRDALVGAWAECWKRTMDAELNKRFLKLKNSDMAQFEREMVLQQSFNQATKELCGKDCGSGGTMKGISYNFCRVGAYKYRIAQAIQIYNNKLFDPMMPDLLPEPSFKNKTKSTKFYKEFANNLCKMPKNVWKEGHPPVDCEKEVLMKLDSFRFTDDVCDLS